MGWLFWSLTEPDTTGLMNCIQKQYKVQSDVKLTSKRRAVSYLGVITPSWPLKEQQEPLCLSIRNGSIASFDREDFNDADFHWLDKNLFG